MYDPFDELPSSSRSCDDFFRLGRQQIQADFPAENIPPEQVADLWIDQPQCDRASEEFFRIGRSPRGFF
jgi:hypothetical protein